MNLSHQRLANQHISTPTFQTAAEVVSWLGAVQSQDYGGGKWAVALRTAGLDDDAIEQACNNGDILRTHVLRPTWHFVTPADIRWMLELTAPRIQASSRSYYRLQGLDTATFKKCNTIIAKSLRNGNHLTRQELAAILTKAGIPAEENLRAGFIMGYAELEGIICSGARRGKQATYALLAERAPNAKSLTRDQALRELMQRYYTAHGPATLADCVWWSGLTLGDVKRGITLCDTLLTSETINGTTYWFAEKMLVPKNTARNSYLLPNYDEYIVGYTDRSAILETNDPGKLDSRGNVLFNNTIIHDGKVIGTWKRTLKKNSVVLELNPFTPLTEQQTKSITTAAKRYSDYLGLKLEMAH